MTDSLDNTISADEKFIGRVLAYLDNQMPDDEITAIEQEMSSTEEKLQLFVDICLQIGMLAESPEDRLSENAGHFQDDDSKAAVGDPNEDLRTWARDMARTEEWKGRGGTRRAAVWLAIAGCVAICLGIGIWSQNQGVAVVSQISGNASLARDGVTSTIAQDMTLRLGDVVRTDAKGKLKLAYTDGTTLHLSNNTQAEFLKGADSGKLVVVRQGHVTADVRPQPAGQPMKFHSDNTQATVVGTRLDFLVESGETLLRVSEGKVRFVNESRKEEAIIETDQVARANVNGSVSVDLGQWPTNRSGIVFLFRSSEHPNVVFGDDGTFQLYRVVSDGDAKFDREGSMNFQEGIFTAKNVEQQLLTKCRASGELTVEALVRPEKLSHQDDARIIAMSRHSKRMNFMLGQLGEKFVFRLNLASVDGRPIRLNVPLGDATLEHWQHIAVTYRPGSLVYYRDGERIVEEQVDGGLRKWKKLPLNFGNDRDVSRAWKGRLRGVAIYSRCLPSDEVSMNARQHRAISGK